MKLALLQKELRSWLQADARGLPAGFEEAAAPGLRVYKNNYRSQLVSCLEHSFPATLAWLGGELFQAACEAHVDAVAPSSWTIDAYARRFPETLARLHAEDLDVFELAWLEWALGEAFVAKDETPLGPHELANVDWDNASIRLAGSMWTVPARTNAGAIWAAIAAEETPPGAQMLGEGCRYLVWRAGLQSRFRTLEAEEFDALLKIAAGASFAELCTSLVETRGEEQAVAAAGEMLGRWISDGLIVGIVDREQ